MVSMDKFESELDVFNLIVDKLRREGMTETQRKDFIYAALQDKLLDLSTIGLTSQRVFLYSDILLRQIQRKISHINKKDDQRLMYRRVDDFIIVARIK